MNRFIFIFSLFFAGQVVASNSCNQLFVGTREGFFAGDLDKPVYFKTEDIGGEKDNKIYRLYSNNPDEQAAVLEFISKRFPHFHKFLMNFIQPGTSNIQITTRKFLEVVAAKIAEWNSKRKTPQGMAVRPAVVYGKDQSDRIVIPMEKLTKGQEPKNSYTFWNIHEQLEALSRGLFAISYTKFTIHDLAHMEIFLRDSEYTWTMIQYAKRYMDGGLNDLRSKIVNPYNPKTQMNLNSGTYTAFQSRYRLLMEGLTLFTRPATSADLADTDSVLKYYDENAIHWGAASSDTYSISKYLVTTV